MLSMELVELKDKPLEGCMLRHNSKKKQDLNLHYFAYA